MLTTFSKAKVQLMLYNAMANKLDSPTASGDLKATWLLAMATLVASPDFPKFVEAQHLTPDARLYEHSIFENHSN